MNIYAPGCWNVKSQNKCGAIEGAFQQASKYKVSAIEEANCNGCEITDLRSHTIFKVGKLSGNMSW